MGATETPQRRTILLPHPQMQGAVTECEGHLVGALVLVRVNNPIMVMDIVEDEPVGGSDCLWFPDLWRISVASSGWFLPGYFEENPGVCAAREINALADWGAIAAQPPAPRALRAAVLDCARQHGFSDLAAWLRSGSVRFRSEPDGDLHRECGHA